MSLILELRILKLHRIVEYKEQQVFLGERTWIRVFKCLSSNYDWSFPLFISLGVHSLPWSLDTRNLMEYNLNLVTGNTKLQKSPQTYGETNQYIIQHKSLQLTSKPSSSSIDSPSLSESSSSWGLFTPMVGNPASSHNWLNNSEIGWLSQIYLVGKPPVESPSEMHLGFLYLL